MAIDGNFEGFYFEIYDFMGASCAITVPFVLAMLLFYSSYAWKFR